MDSQTKDHIETDLSVLRNRLGGETGIRQELVRITVDTLLKGQDAVHYEVVRIFANTLDDRQLIDLLFRLGLKNAIELVKVIAGYNGIKL